MRLLKILSGIILIFGLLFLSGCDDLQLIDVKGPTIEVKVPEWGAYLIAGTFAPFEATFTDDFELATYNIEIHENFSGHGHGRVAYILEDPALLKWSFKQSFTIPAGLNIFQAILEEDIEVPSNAIAGPYHFIVQAIDNAGNSTSFQDDSAIELEVYISNDSQPIINITNLDNGELTIEKDVLFMVEGDITDHTVGEFAGITSMDIILGEEAHDDSEHVHGGRIASADLVDMFFEEQELQQFMVNESIILEIVFAYINFSLSQTQLDELIAEHIDHLLLTIIVNDNQGNIAVSNTDVHVLGN